MLYSCISQVVPIVQINFLREISKYLLFCSVQDSKNSQARSPWVTFSPKESICVTKKNLAMTQLAGWQAGILRPSYQNS